MKGIVKSIMQSGLVWLICFGLFNLQPTWAAGNIDNTNKYAWSENSGWQNFRPTDGGVTVYNAYLSGYAWAENVGYIHFQNASPEYYVKQEPRVPSVTTQTATGIGTTTATGNVNITDLGSSNPTQHGVCWNTSGTPTTADSKTEDGPSSATGAFTSLITGLRPGTDYYVRAYATNTGGTSYGNQISFTSAGKMATGYPHSYKVTVTKVEMYNGTSWVTIFSGTAQLDMVPGGTFPGISDLSLPAGTYSQVRITFKNSFPVPGTLSHGGTAYYTTATTFEGQTNLDSTPTTVAGNMAEFTFYEPAWGALNADVTQTYSITPVTIGQGTDYQPTLRFTVSTTFNLNESAAPSSTEYFTLGVPPVSVVVP